MVPFRDGRCYQLGTRGPCSSGQLLGFDVLRNQTVCADLADSPYSSSATERAELDRNYNQRVPFHDVAVILVGWKRKTFNWRSKLAGMWRKQDDSDGIFRLPTRISEALLVPCRPGARNGNNFKCTNPLV